MKLFLSIMLPIFLFSIPSKSQSFNIDDIGVVKNIIQSNKTSEINEPTFQDILPQKPSIEKTIDHIWNLLEKNEIKGTVAYYFLLATLKTSYGFETKKNFISANIKSYELSDKDEKVILGFINGEKLKSNYDSKFPKIPPVNQNLMFKLVKGIIWLLPISKYEKKEMIQGISEIQNIILPANEANSCYNNDPDCMFQANSGIIGYFSKLVENDEQFLFDALNFYTNLYIYGKDKKPYTMGKDHYTHSTDFDSWQFAMNITDQNPLRTIRVISLFGHDDCCNQLNIIENSTFNTIRELLNGLSKQVGRTHLFKPGALGGAWVKPNILEKIKFIESNFPNEAKNLEFRATYYHLIGGAFSTSELLRRGYGIIDELQFPLILSEGLGYSYKKVTTPVHFSKSATALWKQIGGNLKLCPIKPLNWSSEKYKKGLLELELAKLYILFTQQKHRSGARFIWNEFYKYKFGSYPTDSDAQIKLTEQVEHEEDTMAENSIRCLTLIN